MILEQDALMHPAPESASISDFPSETSVGSCYARPDITPTRSPALEKAWRPAAAFGRDNLVWKVELGVSFRNNFFFLFMIIRSGDSVLSSFIAVPMRIVSTQGPDIKGLGEQRITEDQLAEVQDRCIKMQLSTNWKR